MHKYDIVVVIVTGLQSTIVHCVGLTSTYNTNLPFSLPQLKHSTPHLSQSVSTPLKMPAIKIYYFDFPFWRAEVSRLALHLGNVS